MKKPFLLVLSGPTAVGKSDLAEHLATLLPIELVNGDMGQCYDQLTIGTAKPAWKTSTIPHHLFDIVNEPRDITVVEYATGVRSVLNDIWSRNTIPLIVGGSSFYLSSLFFPPKESTKPTVTVQESDPEKLWNQLYSIDPERALQVGRHDIYRLQRALEIWYTTGEKPSQALPVYNPPCRDFVYMFLTRDRAELCARINRRVKDMFAAGWIAEVERLLGTAWEPFLLKKKIIGYAEIITFLHQKDQSDKEKEKMIHSIAQRTRHYAKRQMTYWRTFSRQLQQYASESVETLHLSAEISFDALVHKIEEKIYET